MISVPRKLNAPYGDVSIGVGQQRVGKDAGSTKGEACSFKPYRHLDMEKPRLNPAAFPLGMTLWLRGWFFYWRAVYKMRTKKHGAGAQPWRYCFAMGRSYRYIVYGQHRRPLSRAN